MQAALENRKRVLRLVDSIIDVVMKGLSNTPLGKPQTEDEFKECSYLQLGQCVHVRSLNLASRFSDLHTSYIDIDNKEFLSGLRLDGQDIGFFNRLTSRTLSLASPVLRFELSSLQSGFSIISGNHDPYEGEQGNKQGDIYSSLRITNTIFITLDVNVFSFAYTVAHAHLLDLEDHRYRV